MLLALPLNYIQHLPSSHHRLVIILVQLCIISHYYNSLPASTLAPKFLFNPAAGTILLKRGVQSWHSLLKICLLRASHLIQNKSQIHWTVPIISWPHFLLISFSTTQWSHTGLLAVSQILLGRASAPGPVCLLFLLPGLLLSQIYFGPDPSLPHLLEYNHLRKAYPTFLFHFFLSLTFTST